MIVDDIMSDCGWTDMFFKEQIKPICDAAIVELNTAGIKKASSLLHKIVSFAIRVYRKIRSKFSS